MKASETSLQPIFEGSKQYIIPLFQRHYSWTNKQWKTLWDDLNDLYESNDGREHFMGAMVTMPVDMQPAGVSKYLLIDGQQRLTTLLIILCALRDAAKEFAQEKLADQIAEQYLINKWANGHNKVKLLPSQLDRDELFAVINGSKPGRTSLWQCYLFFLKKLRGRDSKNLKYELRRMHDIMLQQLSVVSIVLAKDENPYLIFESLNAKGQPLTQADLVRNYLFMKISDQEEQEVAYRDLWRPIEIDLGNNLTDFIWRYLTKDGVFVRQELIYEAIKSRLSSQEAPDKIIDTLIDMHTYAQYYKRLINPAAESVSSIRDRLIRLNRWEISTAYPFLLAIYRDYAERRVSSDEMCQILDMIESYVIRRFFCRVPTNALNRIFIGLYKNLNLSVVVDSVRDYLVSRDWPIDSRFENEWKQFPIYSSGTTKCRHILESLETALTDNNEPVDTKYKRITIEHIMPQVLNEQWEQLLGNEARTVHSIFLHTIGNLTLTGQNEPMGNAIFRKKKLIFEKSNFSLNKPIAAQDTWNRETIENRASELGKLAVRIWQRPGTESIQSVSLDDPTGRKPVDFVLFGQKYEVHTWREILIKSVSVLIRKHGGEDFMAKASLVEGSKRQYVSYSPEGMASAAKLENFDIFVETNLSSRSIISIITQLLVACGHDGSVFEPHWI